MHPFAGSVVLGTAFPRVGGEASQDMRDAAAFSHVSPPAMSTALTTTTVTKRTSTPSATGRPKGAELEALRNRDPEAVTRWVYSQRDYLRAVLARFSRHPSAADDLVQEALYQALRSLPRFRGDSKVTTWLYVIARNVASQHTRYTDRYQTYAEQDLSRVAVTADGTLSSNGPSASTPEHEAIHHEEEHLLYEALEQLKPSYREVIKLRDLKEQSTKETAQKLGLTPSNVRVRLHRARKKLEQVLAQRLPYRVASRG